MVKHAANDGEDVLSYDSDFNLAITESFIQNYANSSNQITIYVDVRAKVYEVDFKVDPQNGFGNVKQIVKDSSLNNYVSAIEESSNTVGFKVYVVLRNSFGLLVPTSYFETAQGANGANYIIASRTTTFENLKAINAMPMVTLTNGNFDYYTYNENN